MVPSGWEVKTLSQITEFIRDGTHGTHKRYESGVPMLSAKDITKNHNVCFEDVPYISEEDYNKIHSKYTIKSGDILLTVVGTLGRIAIVPDNLTEKFTLQRSVAIIRVTKDVSNQFLMQLFSSAEFTRLLHKKSNSTAQAGIYLGELGKINILLPSIDKQQKIAKILSTWDKAISATERLIENSTQQKKALMQQLLTGKKRLLDDEGKRFEGEWERLKLEDVVIRTQLGTSERTKDVEEISTIPLIKMGNLTWGGFSFDKLETLPKSKVDENLILKSGDFLFNTRNTPELVGKSAVWKEQQVEATFDNNINRITFNQNINTDFMCLYLTYGKGKSLISSLSAGSTSVAAIYWKDLKNIKLPVPTLSEQQKIATVLTHADKEIELIEQQLADLQQEKKALMQVLLTGKRRVVIDS